MTHRIAFMSIATSFVLGNAARATAAAQSPPAPPPTAPVPIPDTRAGKVLRAWLEAVNSGDSAAIQAYATTYQPQIPPQGLLQFRRTTGGVDVVRIFVNQPLHLEFLTKDRGSTTYGRGTIDVSDTDPLIAKNLGLRAIPPGAPLEGCTTYQQPPTTIAPGVADPKDVATEDAILAALYDVISGPACQHRDWERFKSLFAPGARLIPTGLNRDRKAVARVETPDEYAAQAKNTLEENGFFEHEVARTGETFGGITHAFSTYESRRKANDEQPFARGINSIQLLNDGTRWWVVTVYWQAERPDSPIPPQYLKKPND
jgi:hypothetical protein